MTRHLFCSCLGLHRRRVRSPDVLGGVRARRPQWLNPLHNSEIASASFLPRALNLVLSSTSSASSSSSRMAETITTTITPLSPPRKEDVCSSFVRCDHALLLAGSWTDRWHVSSTKAHVSQLVDKLTSLGFSTNYMTTFFMERILSRSATEQGMIYNTYATSISIQKLK